MFLISCIAGTDWIEACKSIACLPTEVASITMFIYNAIRIVTPLILVIVGMFDMVKAITAGKEDEIKKSQQLLVKRAVAAVIIFLLFSLISWMLNILSSNDNSTQSVINCLNVLFGEKEDDTINPAPTPTTTVIQYEINETCNKDGSVTSYTHYYDTKEECEERINLTPNYCTNTGCVEKKRN